jgi:hypothetical protein
VAFVFGFWVQLKSASISILPPAISVGGIYIGLRQLYRPKTATKA